MSGVFGMATSAGQAGLPSLCDRMAKSMTSYGDWFQTDCWVSEQQRVALGRIGIGVLNRDQQPVWNADRSVALVMAGETYPSPYMSYEDRTLSPEKLALKYYQRYGEQFASHLDGMFVIAVWDQKRNQILITNDRFGLYPVYYSHSHHRLIFAPEAKGIFQDPSFQKKPDFTALAEYMRLQFLLGDKTFFEDLKLLPGASVLCYDLQEDHLSIQSYWDFAALPQLPGKITFAGAVEEASHRLEAAVQKRMHGDYRLGVYLSGGLDARAILGFASQNDRPVTTITYGKPDSRDAVYAQRLAHKVKADHHYFPFTDGKWVSQYAGLHLDLTEGFHSWIHMHGIHILPQVRPLMDINLSGFGGAEINWEDPALLHAKDDLSFESLLFSHLSQNTTWPSLSESEARFLYSPAMAKEMQGLAFDSFRQELTKFRSLPYPLRAAEFSRQNPDRRMFQYYLVFNRAYVEQRLPFLDYQYTEFIHALPPEMLFQRKLRKAVILMSMPFLAGVPYDKDDLPITRNESFRLLFKLVHKGKSYLHQRTPGLFPSYATLNADYENWLRTDLREWGEDILLGNQTLERGVFNPKYLRSLWNRHQSGLEVNFIGKVAPIMTWEMMMRRFYDQGSMGP